MDAQRNVVTVPAFTGTVAQLWRIDQLTDGSYRIAPKGDAALALVAIGASTPALVRFDGTSKAGGWRFRTP